MLNLHEYMHTPKIQKHVWDVPFCSNLDYVKEKQTNSFVFLLLLSKGLFPWLNNYLFFALLFEFQVYRL